MVVDIGIHDVTVHNYREMLSLHVAPAQLHFIETPKQCLRDAAIWKEYRPVGLYVDRQLVGFAMYGYFPDEAVNGRLWIDRILIDESHQGKGFGRLFMRALIEKLEDEYGRQPIYLSVYQENEGAVHLYERLGFQFINELDINGEQIMRLETGR
nr:GNAT family N-acetyltransferase [Sporosarcina sp. Te-1]